MELSIDRVDGASGEITATFVTHMDHSFYELKGNYEADKRRLFLEPIRGKIGEQWEPCDAEAYVSHDFSTISGISLCEGHGSCDPGGGEFVLRHDRTQFVVEGAGDARVHGQYSSQPRFPIDGAPQGKPASPGGATALYDGAPVYLQACPGDAPTCEDRYAIVHEVIGQFGFWRIVPAALLTTASAANAAMPQSDSALYSVCSEEVYPPDSGWRPLQGAAAPPPAVRAVVRSMYAGLENHAAFASARSNYDPDATSYSAALLGMIGVLLWILFLVALRSGLKLRGSRPKQPKAPRSGGAGDLA